MSPIYVDTAAGSDATGSGDQNAPYQTLAHAYFKHGDEIDAQVRKDAGEPFDKPTQSSAKKAKKDAQGLRKKAQKALEAKDKAVAAPKEKVAGERTTVELKEDTSLPPATKVRLCFSPMHMCTKHMIGKDQPLDASERKTRSSLRMGA